MQCAKSRMYNDRSLTISDGWLMKKVLLVTLLFAALAVPSFSQSTKSNSRGEAYLHFAKARMLAESGKVNDAIAG